MLIAGEFGSDINEMSKLKGVRNAFRERRASEPKEYHKSRGILPSEDILTCDKNRIMGRYER